MGTYVAGFSRAGINTANSPVAALINTATTTRIRVFEIGVGVAVAPTTAPRFYLSRVTARGTQTTTLVSQALDGGDPAAAGTLDSVWSVNPTFSTSAYLTMGGLATTAGGFLVWQFYDDPLMIPATVGAGICIANVNASGATTGTFAGYFKTHE